MIRKNLNRGFTLLVLALCFTMSACKKDKGDLNTLNEAPADTFIPRLNTKYEYRIIEEDAIVGTATKWIDGGKDSSGIKVYNLHTNLATTWGDMALDNSLYAANGRTYLGFNIPDAWYATIAELKKMPNVNVVEAKSLGFPAYMVMENPIREGSKLTWELPAKTGQHLKFIQKSSGSNVTIEMDQEIVQQPGSVVAVETVAVPAGSFTCSKFSYTTSQRQEVKVDGGQSMVRTGTEKVTLWMAHGIGVVKQEAETNFGGTSTKSLILLTNIK